MPFELITGAVVGAAVASSKVRRVVRRGLVLGIGGVLIAYDKVAKATHSVVKEATRESPPKVADSKPAQAPEPGPTPETVQTAASPSG